MMTLKQLKIKLTMSSAGDWLFSGIWGFFIIIIYKKPVTDIGPGATDSVWLKGLMGKHQPQGGQCTGECAEGGVFTLG